MHSNLKGIIIAGATATGKTNIAENIALKLKTEVISADSMQIYKKLNIGTAKEVLKVKQHLIDICEIQQKFTVVDYENLALPLIESLNKQNKLPIICGGTGLYIDSILYKKDYGYDVNFENNENLMSKVNNLLEEKGNNYAYDLLVTIDPETARKIHPNNVRRLKRALYLCLLHKKPLSNIRFKNFRGIFDLYVIQRERAELRDLIAKRLLKMKEKGLKEEIDALYESSLFTYQSMQGIGYKEWKCYYEGACLEEEVYKKIYFNTCAYAKRQDTWFKNQYKDFANFLKITSTDDTNKLIDMIVKKYKGSIDA